MPANETSLPIAAWWALVISVGVIVLVGTDRIMRRALPLVALFRLSLVFPDKAPSRFSIAMRTGTTKQLERQIEEIKLNGVPSDATRHAELMLQLVAALSVHDRLTRGHCERVRAYTDMISEEMGLGQLDAAKLRWAALLHDVGKLFVPAEILNKEGAPTDDEWEVLKSHTWQGDKLIGPLKPWLGEWAAAVGSHHERWDGNGYPNGIRGEAIHIGARIVAVADTFDVITSKRSYKPAISAEKARSEIARCAGSQFDPRVARAFLNIGLGRLRFAIGPLSWLANIPAAGPSSVAPIASPVATAAVAITASVGAVLSGNADVFLNHDTQPDTIAFIDEAPAPTEAIEAPAPTEPATEPEPEPELVAPAPSAPTVDDIRVELDEDERVTVAIPVQAGSLPATLKITSQGSLGAASVSDASVAAEVGGEAQLQYIANPDQNGFDTVGYEVCDLDDRCDSASATITIRALNDAPRIDAPLAQSVHRGDAVGIALSVVDVERDELTFAATGLPLGLRMDPRQGIISGVVADSTVGDHVVTVSVSDSGTPPQTSSATFNIRIVPENHPVAVGSIASTNEDQIVPLVLNATSFDGDLSFSIVTPPARGTLSRIGTPTPGAPTTETPISAGVDYTPDPDAFGEDSLTFKVCDKAGRCDTSTITITVRPVNDAPRLAPFNVTTPEDTELTITDAEVVALATDVEGSDMFVTWGLPEAGSISDNGASVTYTPQPDTASTAIVPFSVCDVEGACTTGDANVVVTAVNDAPLLQPIDDVTTMIGATVSIPALATDVDNASDTLTYQATGLPAGLSIDASTGEIAGTLANPQPADAAQVTVSVSDGSATATTAFVINLDAQYNITTPEALVTLEDTAGEGHISGTTDHGNLTFTLATPPANGTITALSGPTDDLVPFDRDTFEVVYTYTPGLHFNGTDSFDLQICDTETGTACTVVTNPINVIAVNDAPTIEVIPDQPVAGGVAFNWDVDATDPDSAKLSYSSPDLPSGLTIDESTGSISGTPESGHENQTITATVVVTDDGLPAESVSETVSFVFDKYSVAAEAGQLIISEVMYHETRNTLFDEFIEITNVGDVPIDLEEFTLTDFDPIYEGAAAVQAQGFWGTFPTTDLHGAPATLDPGQIAVIWITNPATGGLSREAFDYTETTDDLEFTFDSLAPLLDELGDEVWLTRDTGIVSFVGWGTNDDFATNHRGTSPSPTTGLWDPSGQAALAGAQPTHSISLASNAGWGKPACWEHTGSGTALGNGCVGAQTTVDTADGRAVQSPGESNLP